MVAKLTHTIYTVGLAGDSRWCRLWFVHFMSVVLVHAVLH